MSRSKISHQHETVPFEVRHLKQMGMPEPMVRTAYKIHSQAPGWTGLCRSTVVDVPFAAAGLVMPYPGMAEVWAVLTAGPPSHGIYFYREIARRLPLVFDTFHLHRLQASVVRGHEAGIRLVKHLGFEYEASLRKYGADGEDVLIFSIVRD